VGLLAGGTMRVEVVAPKGTNLQQPCAQDDLYFIYGGTAQIIINEQRFNAAPGDVAVVA
jgi:gentisate 1,2-dioxygenase